MSEGTYGVGERSSLLYGKTTRPFSVIFFPAGYPKVPSKTIARFKTEAAAKAKIETLRPAKT